MRFRGGCVPEAGPVLLKNTLNMPDSSEDRRKSEGIMAKASFPKGVHPPEEKDLTAGSAIVDMPLPEKISIPLSQHLGKPPKALKGRGDTVQAGERIAEADFRIAENVIATQLYAFAYSGDFGFFATDMEVRRVGGSTWTDERIVADPDEVLQIEAGNVTVTEVGL